MIGESQQTVSLTLVRSPPEINFDDRQKNRSTTHNYSALATVVDGLIEFCMKFFSPFTGKVCRCNMRKMWKILFVFAAVAATAEASVHVEVDFSDATFDVKKLPRFWTNTGKNADEFIDLANEYLTLNYRRFRSTRSTRQSC